jgi:hypothetical protein
MDGRTENAKSVADRGADIMKELQQFPYSLHSWSLGRIF